MKTQGTDVHRIAMTYEDYLTYGDSATRTEWVDGEAIVYMPPRDEHQTILEFLYALLRLYTDMKKLGRVRIAPFEVKLWENGPSREPDLVYISTKKLKNLSSKRFSGAPDLAIEVISPGSLYIDRRDKLREYEKARVGEYWIIDSRPDNERADFYRLDSEERYELFATEADEKIVSTALKGFWLRPTWVWRAPPLSPLTALTEVVGKDALIASLNAEDES